MPVPPVVRRARCAFHKGQRLANRGADRSRITNQTTGAIGGGAGGNGGKTGGAGGAGGAGVANSGTITTLTHKGEIAGGTGGSGVTNGGAGGFRRSELVALDCGDVEPVRQGVIITIRRSKTDQEGAGRRVGIPFGRTRHCPVLALERWLTVSGIEAGPMFRPVDRHGRIASERLSGEAVSLILKERVADAGIDPTGFSGHSLRAGFATSAVQAGVSTLRIRSQTGHASDAMLARYVRDGELFFENPAGALL
jgi:Phage integrase family